MNTLYYQSTGIRIPNYSTCSAFLSVTTDIMGSRNLLRLHHCPLPVSRQKIDEKKFDPLFFYCFFGILIGARLGHCLFYDPGQYLTSGKGFVEMLLPIKFLAGGGWKFTGYEGLASHGGTLGLMIALWLYCRKTKLHYMDVVDMIAVATPITACFIRLANLMNSEIIGNPTDVPWHSYSNG